MENANNNYLDNISKLDYQREFSKVESDLNKIKNKLKNKKRVLSELKKEAEIAKYLELLNNPKVVKYLGLSETISKLEHDEFGLQRKYELLSQLMCKHPALLVIEEVTYDLGVYSTCKCLECKKIINTKEQSVNPEALIYIKPKAGFYFINEEEVENVEKEYNELREKRKRSPSKLVKMLNNQDK